MDPSRILLTAGTPSYETDGAHTTYEEPWTAQAFDHAVVRDVLTCLVNTYRQGGESHVNRDDFASAVHQRAVDAVNFGSPAAGGLRR